VAQPEEPPHPSPAPLPGATPAAVAPASHPCREALIAFALAFALIVAAYLAIATPAAWFPQAVAKDWAPRMFALARGTGSLERDMLVATASGGALLVTVETDFRASDYAAIAWSATNIPDNVDVRLIWRSDYAPTKINSAAIGVAAGRLRPVVVAGDPNWIGRIRGLALAINGTLAAPVRISGVSARPMGIVDVARDRVAEWTAFESVTGTSIDSVTGGANIQDLPLPILLAVTVAVAALVWLAFARYRGRTIALPLALATLFVTAWMLDDLRWSWNLFRQARAATATYAGLDWRERHLAAEDGALFQFIEGVRAKLPTEPARVFVAADAHYFRGRAAYHLYPQNVYFEPYRNALPESSRLRPGDYLVAWQRRGIQYDSAAQRLRWDGGAPVSAELLLTTPGAALFRIR
jgi:hypothetical protein